MVQPDGSHQPPRRRRGADLEFEIREAVFAELAEVGYQGLTMQGIARRAGTGKAPLYRRWPNKDQLILAVLSQQPPGQADSPVDTGSLRSDLVEVLTQMSQAMDRPTGRAIYNLVLDLVNQRDQHPQLAATTIDALLEPRLDAIMTALRRAVRRGEIRAGAASELLAGVGPALVIQHQLHLGRLPDRAEITDIIDEVILPALGAQHGSNTH